MTQMMISFPGHVNSDVDLLLHLPLFQGKFSHAGQLICGREVGLGSRGPCFHGGGWAWKPYPCIISDLQPSLPHRLWVAGLSLPSDTH